jgi:hypothetical protein
MSGDHPRESYRLDETEKAVVEAMRYSKRVRRAVFQYAKGFDPRAFEGTQNRDRFADFDD